MTKGEIFISRLPYLFQALNQQYLVAGVNQ